MGDSKDTLRKEWSYALIVICVVAVGTGVVSAALWYADRILPGVHIGPVELGNRSPAHAQRDLEQVFQRALTEPVEIRVGDSRVGSATLQEMGVQLDAADHAARAFRVGREGGWYERLLSGAQGLMGHELSLRAHIEQDELNTMLAARAPGMLQLPITASWSVGTRDELMFVPGVEGKTVNLSEAANILAQTAHTILAATSGGNTHTQTRPTIRLTTTRVMPSITDAEVRSLEPAIRRLVTTPLQLTVDDRTWDIPASTVKSWMSIERWEGTTRVTVRTDALAAHLESSIRGEVERTPQNARFAFADGRASVFSPALDGLMLDTEASIQGIRVAVANGSFVVPLTVKRVAPTVATTEELERLGIQSLIASGESDFRGSPRNRAHNIQVGAERFQGLLISPGEIFAFNEHLGPVNSEHGYKPELVILHNVTTPQYGGGLCQVSTTAFRAAVHAGLEVTERRSHAYPVAYYGTPGFDATIYPNQRTWRDGTDLKFRNDTPGHILIQTKIEGTKLIFEFWGTDDGREVKVVGPATYDRRPDGSVRATLRQEVTRDGSVMRTQEFASRYKSPKLFPRVLAENAERL